jgi:hypothetical protein
MRLFVDVEDWDLKPWEFAKTDRPKDGQLSQAPIPFSADSGINY